MIVHIRIDCDNDAFSPDPDNEIARILYKLAEKLEDGDSITDVKLPKDFNGNTCGDIVVQAGE